MDNKVAVKHSNNLRGSFLYPAGLYGAAAVSLMYGIPAHAAGTIAGTDIENTATATYSLPNGGQASIDSNTVIIKVDELLDVLVNNTDPGDITTQPGTSGSVLTYQVTNTGNGSEAFTLTANVNASGDDFDPTLTQIVLDSDGDGLYDAGTDTVYVSGSNDPILAPDASISVFVITSTPGTVSNGNRGQVDLTAVATTGSGTPGTSFAGQGDGGGTAVVGTTGADSNDNGFLAVQAASVTLVKSATIVDPFGGATSVPGSVITYQITANVSGSGNIQGLKVSDPIPADTTYQGGTLRNQAGALSDAADADTGNFDGTAVSVTFGTVPAGETRSVTFKVKIDE